MAIALRRAEHVGDIDAAREVDRLRDRHRAVGCVDAGAAADPGGMAGAEGAIVTQARVLEAPATFALSLTAGQQLSAGPSQSEAHASYVCVGAETELFNNWNEAAVRGGGTPPTFNTGGKRTAWRRSRPITTTMTSVRLPGRSS
ncbi:MAG: hypothetical protein ACLP01_16065 [Solirubrobacteraceae bacterium]